MLSAFVFDDPHGGMHAMKALFDAGIYAFFASYDPRVLQFKPVLTATDDDIDEIIAIVRRTFPGLNGYSAGQTARAAPSPDRCGR